MKIRGIEYLFHEVRLRQLGQFSLKKKPPRDLTVAFQYLKKKRLEKGFFPEYAVIEQGRIAPKWKTVDLD